MLVAGIKKLGLKPADVKGTMFVWVAIPDGYTSSADYVMELLNKTGVLCTPGSSFGSLGEGHVRFALVLPHEEIENIFLICNSLKNIIYVQNPVSCKTEYGGLYVSLLLTITGD